MGASFRLDVRFDFSDEKAGQRAVAKLPAHPLFEGAQAGVSADGILRFGAGIATSYAHALEALQALRGCAKHALRGHADLYCLDSGELVRLRAGLDSVQILPDPRVQEAPEAYRRIVHPESITALALHSARIALGGRARIPFRRDDSQVWGASVTVWDLETGVRLARLGESPTTIMRLAFDPDGTRLAVGTEGVVQIWSWKDETLIAQARVPGGKVWDVAWSPDGEHLVARTNKGVVLTARGERLAVIERASHEVAWIAPGRLLASSYAPKRGATLFLWNLATRSEEVLPPPKDIVACALSPDGSLVCMSVDREIVISSAQALEVPRVVIKHTLDRRFNPTISTERGWLGVHDTRLLKVSHEGELKETDLGCRLECAVVTRDGARSWFVATAPDGSSESVLRHIELAYE
jgi:hypothetical protein